MSFTVPEFVNDCNVWHFPAVVTDPPALYTVCQLYVNTRGLLDIEEDEDRFWVPPIWLRLPFGADVRRLDVVECPAGSARWYHVRWVELVHLNFPNQYTAAVVHQLPLGPPPPASGGRILLESGDRLLLENGFVLLKE